MGGGTITINQKRSARIHKLFEGTPKTLTTTDLKGEKRRKRHTTEKTFRKIFRILFGEKYLFLKPVNRILFSSRI